MCIQFFPSLYIVRLDRNRQANSILIPFNTRDDVGKQKKKPFLRSPADDDLTAIRRILKLSRVVFILASRRHTHIRHAY
jgi:hypothetical protein